MGRRHVLRRTKAKKGTNYKQRKKFFFLIKFSLFLQYTDLQSRGDFSREDIVTVLTANHGDLDAAYSELSKTQIKPFLMRIWGPPTGTENEAGNEAVMLQKLQGAGKKPQLLFCVNLHVPPLCRKFK